METPTCFGLFRKSGLLGKTGELRMIPLNDFVRQWAIVADDVLGVVQQVGQSGRYVLGDEVKQCETALAAYWSRAHAVGVGSGLDAISISLRCLGLEAGAKVLTTALSAFATTLAILHAGGVPVFVDVDARGQLDLGQCRDVLQRDRSIRTLLPVHLYGLPGDGSELQRLQEDFELAVVEDCAQSIGARFANGRPVGSVGQLAATSFYPTKNLGALGDGGAVLCDDPLLAGQARSIRHYGQSSLYVHSEYGLNSRLDELQAAILARAFLPRLAEWTAARQSIADRYLTEIDSAHLETIRPLAGTSAVWHLFPVLTAPAERDTFRNWMQDQGVMTGVHYPHLATDQKALTHRRFEIAGSLTIAQRMAASEVSLPIHPFLTPDEVTNIIEACNEWNPRTRS